jgi:hypothetical protein
MTTGLSQYEAVLKDYYTKDKLLEQSFFDQPFFATVPKQMAGGKKFIQPIEFANPGGANANFALAMTNETSSLYEDFQITSTTQYQRIVVTNELLLSSRNKDEAFQPAFKEFDRGLRSLGEKIGRRLYRTTTGSFGQLNGSSITGTATMTFADKASIFDVYKGQRLKLSATDGGATYAGVGVVSTIDREAGSLTLTQNVDTAFTGPATTAFVYTEGDEQNGGTAVCLAGLEDWLPVTDRSTKLAASFFGVTRSADAVMLGGVYLNATAMNLDEMLIKLVTKVGKFGGKTDLIIMNPETLGDLMILENSKRFLFHDISISVKNEGGVPIIGFSAVRAVVAGRTVTIISDRNCPSTRVYALQRDTWTLWHKGDLPGFLGAEMGLPMLKPAETQDASEARAGGYCNLGCAAPGWNGVAEVTAST